MNTDQVLKELFLEKGVKLLEIGVNNFAFNSKVILEVLNEINKIKIPVLGGDVCEFNNGRLSYNYDNWYCNRLKIEDTQAFAERSFIYAKNYIENYLKNNKEQEYYFSLVLDYDIKF